LIDFLNALNFYQAMDKCFVMTHHHEDIDYKVNNKLVVAILLHNFL